MPTRMRGFATKTLGGRLFEHGNLGEGGGEGTIPPVNIMLQDLNGAFLLDMNSSLIQQV